MIDVYKIGRIGKPHGIKGEVLMQFADDIFDRADADYLFLEVDSLMVPFFMEEYRFRTDETCIMKFEGIDTADRAAELTGADVYFPRSITAPDGDEGEVSLPMLVGFSVIDANAGEEVGKIIDVNDRTDNVLVTIQTTAGGEALLPLALAKEINKDNKQIIMEIPDGILDL